MADTRTPLMAGNWKMNLDHQQATAVVQKLAWTLDDAKHDHAAVEVAVIPPFTDLRTVQTLVDGDRLAVVYGAQDCSAHDAGAYTGEVSGRMLAKLGCRYVVLGHSERREHHAESDALVAAKARGGAAARRRADRVRGRGPRRPQGRRAGGVHPRPARRLARGSRRRQVAGIVVAYEPVWAIGTGEVATPEDAQEVCGAIRARVGEVHGEAAAAGVRVLYGGSVKPGNIAAIMAQPDVDGALVGGASLDPGDFAAICRVPAPPGRPVDPDGATPAPARVSAGGASRTLSTSPTRREPSEDPTDVDALRIILLVFLGLTSLCLTLLILLHKGKGGGLSDMFGGGHGVQHGQLRGRGAQPEPVHHRDRAGLDHGGRAARRDRAVRALGLTPGALSAGRTTSGTTAGHDPGRRRDGGPDRGQWQCDPRQPGRRRTDGRGRAR